MLGPAGHVLALGRFLVRKRGQERDDRDADRELALSPARAAMHLPRGVEIEWLGTSGYRLGYQGTSILIDPYLTRVSMRDVLLRRAALPQDDCITRYLPAERVGTLAGVLVGHTHFDHALDTPAIARAFGCKVYGSASLGRLMRLHRLGERAVEVEAYRTYDVGPFAVTFVPSTHSKLILGLGVPFDGDISCEHLDELAPSAYGCGQVWGIHIAVGGATIYHQGSADLVDDAVRHRGVDVFLAGIAGRRFTMGYASRILRRLEPRLVVPSHYDDFFRPLDAPMKLSLNVDLTGFVDEVREVSRDFTVHTIAPLAPVRGAPA